MFDNIGDKIKNLAKGIFVVEVIAAIVAGCITLRDSVLVGVLILLLVPIAAWISSWMLYAFGEIAQRLINIDEKMKGNPRKPLQYFDMNKPKEIEPIKSPAERDSEILYQFALEKISKKQYKFAIDALKRIPGYKDSDALLKQIEGQ